MNTNFEDIFDGKKHIARIYEEDERNVLSWREHFMEVADKCGEIYNLSIQRIYATDIMHPRSWKAIIKNGMIVGMIYACNWHDPRSWCDYFIGSLHIAHIVASDINNPESWFEKCGYAYAEYANTHKKHGHTFKERFYRNNKKDPRSWRRVYSDGNCISHTVADDPKNEESWVLLYLDGTIQQLIVADNPEHPKSYKVIRYNGQPTGLVKYGDGSFNDLDDDGRSLNEENIQ